MPTIWDRITPQPRSRNLVVASVGSGKSTVGATLMEAYHLQWPSHRIYIVDLKQRFVPDFQRDESRIFFEGTTARNHGRIEGVKVNGRLVEGERFRMDGCGIYIIHRRLDALALFRWLFEHADVRKPVMIYNDESIDLMKGMYLEPSFKRIVQMGREKGIGHTTVNQRPKGIDQTLISESERIYVGTLHNVNDRIRLAQTVSIPRAKELLIPMPKYVFWMVDQVSPEKSLKFTFKQGG